MVGNIKTFKIQYWRETLYKCTTSKRLEKYCLTNFTNVSKKKKKTFIRINELFAIMFAP